MYKRQYTDKTLKLKKIYEYASELRKFCWYLRYFVSETYILRSQNYIFIHIQLMQFPFITYGMALHINESIPTKHLCIFASE